LTTIRTTFGISIFVFGATLIGMSLPPIVSRSVSIVPLTVTSPAASRLA
jgi:hypothetical protein